MALISSSYSHSLPPGISGVLPITVPPPMPYSSAGNPWMRVPLHFPGFSPVSFSPATAAFLSAPRAKRLGLDSPVISSSPLKRLAFSPPVRKSKRVTNFSIEGILGKQDEEEDFSKILVVDTNSYSEPMSPVSSPLSDKEERLLGSPDELQCSETVDGQGEHREMENNPMTRFSWLQCTRYKPPRLPRAKRTEGVKKRKLGRNPRVPFSPAQVATLEHKFRSAQYLSCNDVAELSAALNLAENRVKIWFQNRRARERRDKEAADNGDVSSNIRSPTTIQTSSNIPSSSPHHQRLSSAIVSPSAASTLSLSSSMVMPRLPSSSVGVSAFTPVTYDMKAMTAAAMSSMHMRREHDPPAISPGLSLSLTDWNVFLRFLSTSTIFLLLITHCE